MLAEQEAWKIARSSGLDLVTILPNFVLGPVLSSRADGTSVGLFEGRAIQLILLIGGVFGMLSPLEISDPNSELVFL